MEVSFNPDLNPIRSSRPSSAGRSSPAATPAPDFRQADALTRALEETPEARPEVVERGLRLVSDPDYPPLSTIRQMAAFLVQHLSEDRDQ